MSSPTHRFCLFGLPVPEVAIFRWRHGGEVFSLQLPECADSPFVMRSQVRTNPIPQEELNYLERDDFQTAAGDESDFALDGNRRSCLESAKTCFYAGVLRVRYIYDGNQIFAGRVLSN